MLARMDDDRAEEARIDGVAVVRAAGGPGSPVTEAAVRALVHPVQPLQAVVLVEGRSDQVALEALALRRGRDLADDGVAIVPTGGASAIGRFLVLLRDHGPEVVLAGLYDAAEEAEVRRALGRLDLAGRLDRDRMTALGFHRCVADLEDELIRALGVEQVLQVVEAAGDLRSWQTFQRQPAQRARPVTRQLRRFLGTRSGRKIAYARLLVEALDLDAVPRPLDGVLAGV